MTSKIKSLIPLVFASALFSVSCSEATSDKSKTPAAPEKPHVHSPDEKPHVHAAENKSAAQPTDHAHDHTPKHGGVITEEAHTDFELVAKSDRIQLFISDHGAKVKLDGGTAKLTLLSSAGKQEVDLKQVDEKFEATGTFKVGAGTKAVAVVTLPGKPAISARFTLK